MLKKKQEVCPICLPDRGQKADSTHDRSTNLKTIRCERCGDYSIDSDTASDILKPRALAPAVRLQLSRYIAEQGRPREPVKLPDKVRELERLATRGPSLDDFQGFYDRVLLWMASQCGVPGGEVVLDAPRLAGAAMLSEAQLHTLLREMSEDLVATHGSTNGRGRYTLRQAGWERVRQLQRGGPKGSSAFVAMHFDPLLDDFYRQGFARALKDCGYRPPFRTDDSANTSDEEQPSRIDDQILAAIRKSSLVVAEASGARPNVYYEAGLATGLGIPVLWCCQRGQESTMAFDTRQFSHIMWSSAAELRVKLRDRIVASGLEAPEKTR